MAESAAVIDTAPLIAFLGGAERSIGKSALRYLARARSGRVQLIVPTVCLFEVGLLEERGRITLVSPFEEWCDLLQAIKAVTVLPLERAHVSEARALPTLRDPFDRLIAGTAVALGLPLITADTRIAGADRVAVIW